MSVVVSDTSPLHYLVQCDCIAILPTLFQSVVIPPAVAAELRHPNTPKEVSTWFASNPAWLTIQAPANVRADLKTDQGEREAISLALELHAEVLLIDDLKGRNEAKRVGLRVTGTVGLLLEATRRKLANPADVLAKLERSNARLSNDLLRRLRDV